MKILTTIILSAAMALTACGSSKQLAQDTTTVTKSATTTTKTATTKTATTTKSATTKSTTTQQSTTTTTAKQQSVVAPGVTQFVSDLDLTIAKGKDSYDLGGKVSMKRDQVVRLNLTFMGFIEVGIIEFAPDYILIVNRMQKEYTKTPYDGLDVLKKNKITFQSIESMAWEKLYPGEGKKLNDSSLDEAIENMINGNIKSGEKVSVKIQVGKPDTKKEFETYTTVKSSYKEVPAQTLMTKLMNFAK